MTQILWKSYILSSYVVRYVLQNLMGGKKLKFDEMYQLFERKQPFSIKSTVFESSKKIFMILLKFWVIFLKLGTWHCYKIIVQMHRVQECLLSIVHNFKFHNSKYRSYQNGFIFLAADILVYCALLSSIY